MNNIICGDCIEVLKTLDADSVQCCVTSPPYYGLRDYGVEGQIGLEETPEAYIEKLVTVFREVRRVLKPDGVLWLNLGDSYWGGKGKSGYELPDEAEARRANGETFQTSHNIPGYRDMRPTDGKHPTIKPKDLIGIPWMAAFALRADGWYLRMDVIWHKPNPMPESVTDRPTKSHEYIFLMSKSAQYFYDAEAIAEPVTDSTVARLSEPGLEFQGGSFTPSKGNGNMKAVRSKYTFARTVREEPPPGKVSQHREDREPIEYKGKRNKRSVWTVTTKPYKEAHFATFPMDLIEPCILAGSRPGDIVLDPFNGSGTTGAVAIKHHRDYVGIELNPAYVDLTNKRFSKVQPVLFAAMQP